MYKESSCGNYSTNNYLKVCDLQSAFNSSDSPTLMLTHSHTHTPTQRCMQPTVQEMHFYKLMPRHQIHTAVQIWLFIESLLTDRLLNSKHCVHIETNWSLLLPNSIVYRFQTEEVLCDSLPAARVCDFHHRRNREYAFYADAVYKQSAFSFPSRETKVILGQETAKDQIIPYSWWKPTQNLHRKQRKSSEITILWEMIVTSISIWRLGMHRSAVTVFCVWTVLWFYKGELIKKNIYIYIWLIY